MHRFKLALYLQFSRVNIAQYFALIGFQPINLYIELIVTLSCGLFELMVKTQSLVYLTVKNHESYNHNLIFQVSVVTEDSTIS